jgi:hypothetical protein
MDFLLEPPLNSLGASPDHPGQMAGRPLEEWNDAYTVVESYFRALQVRNKLMLGQLVVQVLKRAMARAYNDKQLSTTELAVEELDSVVNEWFAEVLNEHSVTTNHILSTRGRLALLLADMPGKWQDQFLQPAPWNEEFVTTMREAYLRAGPDFQLSKMALRPLDLGPINTLTNLSRLPVFKYIAWMSWALVGVFFVYVFLLTH